MGVENETDAEHCPECGEELEFDLRVGYDYKAEPVMKNYWYCEECDQHYRDVPLVERDAP